MPGLEVIRPNEHNSPARLFPWLFKELLFDATQALQFFKNIFGGYPIEVVFENFLQTRTRSFVELRHPIIIVRQGNSPVGHRSFVCRLICETPLKQRSSYRGCRLCGTFPSEWCIWMHW